MGNDLHTPDKAVLDSNTTAIPLKKKGGRPRKGTPEAARAGRVQALIQAGVTSPALLAETCGISDSGVRRYLDKYNISKESITLYVKERADILRAIQDRISQELLKRDLEKVSVRDLVVSKGILYDKERLETGKSTQNVAGILARVVRLDDEETKAARSAGQAAQGAHEV